MEATNAPDPKPRLPWLVLVFAVGGALVAAVAGCGGGNEQQGTLTKSQVIAQGGAICRRAEKGLKDLPEPSFKGPFAQATPAQQQQARKFVRGYADLLESSRQGLAALNAPERDRQLLDGYLHDTGTVVEDLRAAAAAPAARVEAKANHAFQLFSKASKQTADYGFPKGVCGAG